MPRVVRPISSTSRITLCFLLQQGAVYFDTEDGESGEAMATVTRTTDVSSTASAAPSTVAKSARLWKAGELARQTGLTRQSLHQYVLLGLLEPLDTTKGGQRLFGPDSVDRVKLIRDLVGNGYTLRDIRDTFFSKPKAVR